jgi:SAM-dependent methyltransferase
MKAELSDVDRAHAAYTRRSLAFYDWWVLGISNRSIWKCETEKILDLYRAKLSANHLEVGVGTGYFLEHSLPEGYPRIALLDINRDCLDRTAKRIAAYKPEVHQDNVLEPIQLKGERFDSIAINYLLHCLPGALEVKAGKVCDHLIPYLENDGVLFGSTILGLDIQRPMMAKLLMRQYNKKGIFSNTQDSLGGIMETLSKRFKTFNVEVRGCVVLFWGKGLRDGYRHADSTGQ